MILTEMNVELASPVPVYEQIKKKIKHAIAKRSLAVNDTLPSIRELASFLKINPNTVARAYRELSQESIIDGRAGIGFWVKETTGDLEKEKEIMLREEFLKLLEKAVELGISQERLKGMVSEFFTEET
jgi:GntR family transcriptional regulator